MISREEFLAGLREQTLKVSVSSMGCLVHYVDAPSACGEECPSGLPAERAEHFSPIVAFEGVGRMAEEFSITANDAASSACQCAATLSQLVKRPDAVWAHDPRRLLRAYKQEIESLSERVRGLGAKVDACRGDLATILAKGQ